MPPIQDSVNGDGVERQGAAFYTAVIDVRR